MAKVVRLKLHVSEYILHQISSFCPLSTELICVDRRTDRHADGNKRPRGCLEAGHCYSLECKQTKRTHGIACLWAVLV